MEAVTALTESLLGELLLRRKLHKYVLPRVKVLFLAGTVIGSFPFKKKKNNTQEDNTPLGFLPVM